MAVRLPTQIKLWEIVSASLPQHNLNIFVIFKHMLRYFCLYTLLFMEVDKLCTTYVQLQEINALIWLGPAT